MSIWGWEKCSAGDVTRANQNRTGASHTRAGWYHLLINYCITRSHPKGHTNPLIGSEQKYTLFKALQSLHDRSNAKKKVLWFKLLYHYYFDILNQTPCNITFLNSPSESRLIQMALRTYKTLTYKLWRQDLIRVFMTSSIVSKTVWHKSYKVTKQTLCITLTILDIYFRLHRRIG